MAAASGCAKAPTRNRGSAFPRKADVDANYIKLMRLLLPSGFYHGIATHDPRMIAETIRWAAEKQISKDDFEFQMLYGVRTDLQRQLVQDGYRLRIYIPFGQRLVPLFHAPPGRASRRIWASSFAIFSAPDNSA